jgi:hypothetical protein
MSLVTFLNLLSRDPFKKSEDGLEVSLTSYGLVIIYHLQMETSTRIIGIIDYHMKGCMVGGFIRMKSTGRHSRERGLRMSLTTLHPMITLEGKDYRKSSILIKYIDVKALCF